MANAPGSITQPPIFRGIRLLLCCLSGLIFSLSAYSQSLPHWQEPSYITESFINVALRREYRNAEQTSLVRWQTPIRIHIDSEVGDAEVQTELYRLQADHLAGITGHPIGFVDTISEANVRVVFTTASRMRSHAQRVVSANENLDEIPKSALCLANFKTNRKAEIIQGTVLIPVDLARQKGKLVDCVIEELTQLMGLPNDSNRVYPSIFNDASIDSYLSGLDYLLLKIAYHPTLKAGMSEQQVRKLLPSILARLGAEGEIEHAERRVLSNSLQRRLEQ